MIHDLFNRNTYFMQKKVSLIDYHLKMKIRAGMGSIGAGGCSPRLFLFKGNTKIAVNVLKFEQCCLNIW